MENMKGKQKYFTENDIYFRNRRFAARSIVISSKDPGPPFEKYDAEKHGRGYLTINLDDWLKQLGE